MSVRTPGFIAVVLALVALPGGAALAADQSVDVQDNAFVPPTVTIAPGDSVTWTQSGSNPHSVTAEDDSFDSHPNCPPVCMDSGDEFSHMFDEPGEYGYFCKIHGAPGEGMSGTVIVQAADPPNDPPPDQLDDDSAAHDDEALPRTGGGALAVVGVLVFAAGVFAFRRRGKD